MTEKEKVKRAEEIAKKVAEIQAANPDREIVTFESEYAWAAFKIPNGTEYDRYRALVRSNISEANKTLLANCLAWPEKERFAEILDRRPHLVEKWADKLTDAAGAEEVIEVKKH